MSFERLGEQREVVKDFVRDRWSDEKVAQVLAFNQDGKMDALNSCCCLRGAHTSRALHVGCYGKHYWGGDMADVLAELAYIRLGVPENVAWSISNIRSSQPERDLIFGEILVEIMTEREVARWSRHLNTACA